VHAFGGMHCFGECVPEIRAVGRNLPLAFFVLLRYQADMNTTPIEELARKLADAVPEGVRSIQSDLEKSFRSVLQTGIGKLDLVTREEFEVQEAILARTREKLEALEARLKDLENP